MRFGDSKSSFDRPFFLRMKCDGYSSRNLMYMPSAISCRNDQPDKPVK